MRGVPDVSGDADPDTGYNVRIDGTNTVIGGTSAVAPLWAGLIARINAAKGSPAGLVNPLLYAAPTALRDITQGNNGDFDAAPGVGCVHRPGQSEWRSGGGGTRRGGDGRGGDELTPAGLYPPLRWRQVRAARRTCRLLAGSWRPRAFSNR